MEGVTKEDRLERVRGKYGELMDVLDDYRELRAAATDVWIHVQGDVNFRGSALAAHVRRLEEALFGPEH